MGTKLPRLSKKNTAQALEYLTTIKIIKSHLSEVEKACKAYLVEKAFEPGTKVTAHAPNGADIATVSITKPAETLDYEVTDEDAYAAWLQVHEPADYERAVQTVQVVREWAKKGPQLALYVQKNDGALPNGVNVKPSRPPHVVVRQSPAQADNYLANYVKQPSALPQLGGRDE